MVSETILVTLQYGCVFAMTVVFSLLAMERKTIVSNLVASLMWVTLAMINFVVGYTIIGSTVSWLFGIVCFIFMGGFIMGIISAYDDYKAQRWDMGGF